MRHFGVLGLCATILITPSCSLFTSSVQSVIISPSDPAAEVLVNGVFAGQGTITLDLKRNRSHSVMARVGDRVGTAQVGYGISSTGVLDIVGGVLFLVPFLGALGPGFWELDATHIVVALPPAR